MFIRFGRLLTLVSTAFALSVLAGTNPAFAQDADENAAEETAAAKKQKGGKKKGKKGAAAKDTAPAEDEADEADATDDTIDRELPDEPEPEEEPELEQEAEEQPEEEGDAEAAATTKASVEVKSVKPKPAPAAEPPAPAADASQARDTQTSQDIVTRLPPSPEVRIRGIKFGSLARTWHGLQWPIYQRTGLPISGDVWVDNGWERQERGLETEQNRSWFIQAGRFKLRASPTYTKGPWFVQGQGEVLAWSNPVRGNLPIYVDDAWVKGGAWDIFDLQIGRFQAWEVYHKGLGFDLYTLEYNGAIDVDRDTRQVWLYELDYMFYRQDAYGQFAVHVYPTDFLRFELGGVIGNELGGVIGNELGLNAYGIRPVGILDFGWLKFKVGAEYKYAWDWEDGRQTEAKSRGVGAALQFVFDPWVEFGFNFTQGIVDRILADGRVDVQNSINPRSIGGFLNVNPIGDLVLGVGAHQTVQEDLELNNGVYGWFQHTQFFGAIVHPIITDDLTAKLVVAYAEADLRPAFDNWRVNTMQSIRLRVQYDF